MPRGHRSDLSARTDDRECGSRRPSLARRRGTALVARLAGAKIRPVTERAIGDLDEVLNNLGVFSSFPERPDRAVPVRLPPGADHPGRRFLHLVARARAQPDGLCPHASRLGGVGDRPQGSGQALIGPQPVPLTPGVVVGRAAAHPHGFYTHEEPMHLLSIQLPRPASGSTTWDEPGETTEPIECRFGGHCRRCHRCGGHSRQLPGGPFGCENCTLEF